MNSILDVAMVVTWIGVSLFALLKGDRSEKQAGAVLLMSWLVAKAAIDFSGAGSARLIISASDVATTIIFGALAWQSPRSWPVWGTAFEVIGLTTDASHYVGLDLSTVAYLSAANISAYGVCASLAVGTWLAWREREALRPFDIEVPAS